MALLYAAFALTAAIAAEAAVLKKSVVDPLRLARATEHVRTGDASAILQSATQTAAQFRENEYAWPSPRGKIAMYSVGASAAPFDLSKSLAWSWHHPEGKYHSVLFGATMDGKQNIYLTCAEGLRKFDPDGKVVWEYKRGQPGYSLTGEITTTASLADGRMYSTTTACEAFAVDMETGKELWIKKISKTCGGDSGFTMAFQGVALYGSDAKSDNLKTKVQALNATDGAHLWDFSPQAPTWTFCPFFAGDGTFVFQDIEGRAYRLNAFSGKELWRAGGYLTSWTDGQALLGYNGIVYTTSRFKPQAQFTKMDAGRVSAFRLSDGTAVWSADVPRAPNSSPALGRLYGDATLSLVLPVGSQVVQGAETDIHAFDAATGAKKWLFRGPVQQGEYQRGEVEGYAERLLAGVRPMTLPHPWSAPSVSEDGTVYIGNEEGFFFALRDTDGDGFVSEDTEGEVSKIDTAQCFHGNAAPIISEGLLAIPSTDTLYVFKKAPMYSLDEAA